MMLFLGFRLFSASFEGGAGAASAGFPSPKSGAGAVIFRNVGGFFLGSRLMSDSFTPHVGGVGKVARGFGLMIGASEG